VPFAVEEQRLDLVRIDLFGGSPHLLVFGDAECGKTSLLRLLARQLAARHPPDEVALLVVDLRRGLLDLTAIPNLVGYACTPATVAQAVSHLHRDLTERAPADVAPPPELLARGWVLDPPVVSLNGSGKAHAPSHPRLGRPRYVVLVDDYDLLPASSGSPLLPLLDLLGLGRELGVHVVLARRVAGAARAAFEPVFQRLRELGGPGRVMTGDPGEGPMLGGQKAARLPPGRGFLVRPRQPPTLVQVVYSPAPAAAGSSEPQPVRPPGASADRSSGAGRGQPEGGIGEG
jgi:S-DNA-T family DNA segregation ATPase FtsK/SpoIIIE